MQYKWHKQWTFSDQVFLLPQHTDLLIEMVLQSLHTHHMRFSLHLHIFSHELSPIFFQMVSHTFYRDILVHGTAPYGYISVYNIRNRILWMKKFISVGGPRFNSYYDGTIRVMVVLEISLVQVNQEKVIWLFEIWAGGVFQRLQYVCKIFLITGEIVLYYKLKIRSVFQTIK